MGELTGQNARWRAERMENVLAQRLAMVRQQREKMPPNTWLQTRRFCLTIPHSRIWLYILKKAPKRSVEAVIECVEACTSMYLEMLSAKSYAESTKLSHRKTQDEWNWLLRDVTQIGSKALFTVLCTGTLRQGCGFLLILGGSRTSSRWNGALELCPCIDALADFKFARPTRRRKWTLS